MSESAFLECGGKQNGYILLIFISYIIIHVHFIIKIAFIDTNRIIYIKADKFIQRIVDRTFMGVNGGIREMQTETVITDGITDRRLGRTGEGQSKDRT